MNALHTATVAVLLSAPWMAAGQETAKTPPAKSAASAAKTLSQNGAKTPIPPKPNVVGPPKVTPPTRVLDQRRTPPDLNGPKPPIKEPPIKAYPPGQLVSHARDGSMIARRADGKVADLHVPGRDMEIHHNLTGVRRVEVERADHSRIVAEHGHFGYVERPYFYRGREYAHRTYYFRGRAYERFYARYEYHHVYVAMYTPVVYYHPAFYVWVYSPWAAPVPYAWGWAGAPWYGYYGVYYAPYPIYPNPSVWLTDYIISASLADSYQASIAAGVTPPPPPADAMALSPQVKDLVAAEVQRQLAIENAEAQTAAQNAPPDPELSGIQALLYDGQQHVFIASRDLDVVDAGGGECAISEGDALKLIEPPPADAAEASLIVLWSKGNPECHKGSFVSVNIADLQDMENHLRETIDQGLGELQSGRAAGLPPMPAPAAATPVAARFAADAPKPEPNAGAEIAQQVQAADAAERDAAAAGPPQPPPPVVGQNSAAPPTIDLMGKSMDEVRALYGPPLTTFESPTKTVYVYQNVKVTFNNGKVTNID